MLKFGILILNRNGEKWIPGLLDSLDNDNYTNKQVYLVDNASTDNSVTLCKDFSNIRLVCFDENLGYSKAYNIAVQEAWDDGCEWTILLNNDTLVYKNWLLGISKCVSNNPDAGIIGPYLRNWDGNIHSFLAMRYSEHQLKDLFDNKDVACDWVQGSCLAISRRCWDSIGGLDEDLFFYWEDADICRRARYRGFSVLLTPDSWVKHYGGGSALELNSKKANFKSRLTKNHYAFKALDPYTKSHYSSVAQIIRLYISYITCTYSSESFIKRFAFNTFCLFSFASKFVFWRRKRFQFVSKANLD